jgi:hypothetical protein
VCISGQADLLIEDSSSPDSLDRLIHVYGLIRPMATQGSQRHVIATRRALPGERRSRRPSSAGPVKWLFRDDKTEMRLVGRGTRRRRDPNPDAASIFAGFRGAIRERRGTAKSGIELERSLIYRRSDRRGGSSEEPGLILRFVWFHSIHRDIGFHYSVLTRFPRIDKWVGTIPESVALNSVARGLQLATERAGLI